MTNQESTFPSGRQNNSTFDRLLAQEPIVATKRSTSQNSHKNSSAGGGGLNGMIMTGGGELTTTTTPIMVGGGSSSGQGGLVSKNHRVILPKIMFFNQSTYSKQNQGIVNGNSNQAP